MSSTPRSEDISGIPELVRIAEEVATANEPRMLRRDGHDVAKIVPLRRRKPRAKELTPGQIAAFESAAGSWADVDTDKLIEEIYARRRAGSKPPVDL